MATSYEIGYSHGNRAGGTNNHKPGALNLEQYNAGFQAGMSAYHAATALQRAQDAWMNQPNITRSFVRCAPWTNQTLRF